MYYTGRITITVIAMVIISGWHTFYFFKDFDAAYQFFIDKGFIIYDFIFPPLLIPLLWWLGKQYDLSKFLSEKDVLTKVYNRRYVLQTFPKLVGMVDKVHKPLSIFVIDVDQFKLINDQHGHKMGDRVLRIIADSLQRSIRKQDIVARWGGDEFIIIAPFTTKEQGKVMIQKIKDELNHVSQHLAPDVSVSIGMAEYPKDNTSLDGLIHQADQEMYSCKFERKEAVNTNARNKECLIRSS